MRGVPASAFVLACAVSIASAQTAAYRPPADAPADPDLVTDSMRRLGPFHVAPFLVLKNAGYDDNIRLESTEREGDTTATVGPGVRAVILAGDRGGFHLSQEFDYVAFARNTDLNHWNGDTRARGILILKRAVVSLEDRLTSQRERPNTEIDRRLRRDNNAVTAALRTTGHGRLGLRMLARQERIDYSTDDVESELYAARLDRDERTLSLQGEMRILNKTTFTLESVAQRADFHDAAQRRDARSVSLLPGVRFDPTATVQGELKVGPTSLIARERAGNDFHGLTGQARLSTRLGHFARLKGVFDRAVAFSTYTENLYYVNTFWSAAYQQYFTRRLSGEILHGRGLNSYPERIVRPGADPFDGFRDDRLTTYEASISWRVNPQMSLVARATRLRRDSTDDFYDRDRNFYAIGSTLVF